MKIEPPTVLNAEPNLPKVQAKALSSESKLGKDGSQDSKQTDLVTNAPLTQPNPSSVSNRTWKQERRRKKNAAYNRARKLKTTPAKSDA